MTIAFTPDLGLEKPDLYQDLKEQSYANSFDSINRAVGGYLPVASGDTNYTLQDVGGARESRTFALKLTSTLTAARVISIDTTTSGKYRNRFFLIWNATAGGFKVTVKTTAGGSTGIDIANGTAILLWHDGTNVYALSAEVVPTTAGAPAFTAPTLTNSWVNFGAPYEVAGYTKVGNKIELQGMIKSGASGTVAFTLPAGYRPANTLEFQTNSNGGSTAIDIASSGTVTIFILTGTNASVSLSGISFRV